MSYDTVATSVLLDVIEVGVITPVEPDLYVAVTSVVAESPKLIVFEPVLPPTLSTIDVTGFASCFPDVTGVHAILPPSPLAVTVKLIFLLVVVNVSVFPNEGILTVSPLQS